MRNGTASQKLIFQISHLRNADNFRNIRSALDEIYILYEYLGTTRISVEHENNRRIHRKRVQPTGFDPLLNRIDDLDFSWLNQLQLCLQGIDDFLFILPLNEIAIIFLRRSSFVKSANSYTLSTEGAAENRSFSTAFLRESVLRFKKSEA